MKLLNLTQLLLVLGMGITSAPQESVEHTENHPLLAEQRPVSDFAKSCVTDPLPYSTSELLPSDYAIYGVGGKNYSLTPRTWYRVASRITETNNKLANNLKELAVLCGVIQDMQRRISMPGTELPVLHLAKKYSSDVQITDTQNQVQLFDILIHAIDEAKSLECKINSENNKSCDSETQYLTSFFHDQIGVHWLHGYGRDIWYIMTTMLGPVYLASLSIPVVGKCLTCLIVALYILCVGHSLWREYCINTELIAQVDALIKNDNELNQKYKSAVDAKIEEIQTILN